MRKCSAAVSDDGATCRLRPDAHPKDGALAYRVSHVPQALWLHATALAVLERAAGTPVWPVCSAGVFRD